MSADLNGQIGREFFLSVAVPRPLDGLFTYSVRSPLAETIQAGSVVRVPFGKSTLSAVVIEAPKAISELPAELKGVTLRSVLEGTAHEFVLPEDVLALCKWAQDYYKAPPGEILGSAVSLEMLKAKGKRKEKEKPPKVFPPVVLPTLTDEQETALSQLETWRKATLAGRPEKNSHVALLHGVTGSGKTELYIELARRTLAEGKSVIVLVPEIALTPQLHERFERGLGMSVGLWHSAVAAGERRRLWLGVRKGEIRVVVGARSAVFAPVQDLGLVVVDEEHDASYKQEDRARYNARDLAVVRGKMAKAFVVLGSATPSLETLYRVEEGRYHFAELKQRAIGGGMPQIEIVDLCVEERVENIRATFAKRTLDEIQKTLDDGKRVIIFLNRRGFASFLVCEDCGESPTCPNCSVSLTAHRRGTHLRCHVCGFHQKTPDLCPKCQGLTLAPVGAGTESLEEELPLLIKGMIPVRLDRDQVTSATRLKKTLDTFRKGEANVLLGTQMLVKGHDFPEVTLVVVVLADALFRWPDFRAAERALQLLTQVSGRAGRGDAPGRVLIQTFAPDHPVLQVVRGDKPVRGFLDEELELRKVLSYPPFGRLARLRLEATEQRDAQQRAQSVAQVLSGGGVEILGPSEALLEKAKGKFRWDILIKAGEIGALHGAVQAAKRLCQERKWPLVVDVDPYSVG